MNKSIKLLDVTLRDGGSKVNFQFSPHLIKNMLSQLDDAGLDYIEIGYRNGLLTPSKTLGVAGNCPSNYLTFCKKIIQKSKLSVMAHPNNLGYDDLAELKDCGIDLLRLCLKKGELNQLAFLLEKTKRLKLNFSVNLTQISHYCENELDKTLAFLSEFEPNMIYFADSNGSLFPEKIEPLYAKFTKSYSNCFGFHAHDNLGLAQANAISAIHGGAQCIDVSVMGLGKGVGNLRSESFIAYLCAIGTNKYDLYKVISAANQLQEFLNYSKAPIKVEDFMRGIFDVSLVEAEKKAKTLDF